MSLPESDEQLVRRMAEQDKSALLELHNRYAHRLVAFIGRMEADPDRVMQSALDTFAYVWTHAKQFDPTKTSARAWLVTVCHRLTLNRRRGSDLDPMPLQHWDVHSREDGPAAAPPEDVIGNLSHEARDTLELAFYQGLTQQQVAAETATPLNAVRTAMRDALRGLRGTRTGDEA